MNTPKYASVGKASNQTGLSESTIRRKFDCGKLDGHIDESGKRIIVQASINKLLDEMRARANERRTRLARK